MKKFICKNPHKQLFTLGVCVLFLTISGCKTNYFLLPELYENNHGETEFVDGIKIASSTLQQSTVSIFGKKTQNNELSLYLAITNLSKTSKVDFMPQDVKISAVNSKGESVPLQAIPHDTYIQKLETAQNTAIFLQAISGSINASNAGYKSSYNSASTYGSNGYATGTAYTTAYDQSKVEEARSRNNEELKSNMDQYHQILLDTKNHLLKPNTLHPLQKISGQIMVDFNFFYCEKYIVEVPVGKDIHKFKLVPEADR